MHRMLMFERPGPKTDNFHRTRTKPAASNQVNVWPVRSGTRTVSSTVRPLGKTISKFRKSFTETASLKNTTI